MSFIKSALCELSGQPSSKRLIAFILVWFAGTIILSLCFVLIWSVILNQDLKPGVVNVIYFTGTVLWAVLSFIATLLGFAMSQNKEAIGKGIVTDLNKVTSAQ